MTSIPTIGRDVCQLCGAPLTTTMYDAKTRLGPWAYLCAKCFRTHTRCKLGVGVGQKYVRVGDNWVKEEPKGET